jgi:phage FluMu protein Com
LKKYVTDKNILDKIGVTENMYAIYTGNTNKTENIYNNKSSFNIDNIDNSKCKANFETVISDYKCVQDYMSGEIEVYTDNHELIGIYDSTGIYQMESGINTIGYLGEEGKARCIALPQCKMMNSTVFDDIAEHKVYIGKYNGEKYKSLINLGKSGIDWKKEEKRLSWLQEIGFEVTGTHLSFDLWQVIGAVFGKALLVWRAIEKFDMDKMPEYMTIHISEIYESFVVNSKWSNLSNKTKMIWKNKLFEVFDKLNKLSMLYDLPDDEYNRIAYCATSILKSS